MLALDTANIIFDMDAADRDDCIKQLAALMQRNGYIGEDYVDCVIQRENEYPTGLPTDGVQVAIPHSNKGTVYKTGIGVAVLKSPVSFFNMVDKSEALNVELVFMIANTDPDKQLSDLRKLMCCFSEECTLVDMKKATTADEIVKIIRCFNEND